MVKMIQAMLSKAIVVILSVKFVVIKVPPPPWPLFGGQDGFAVFYNLFKVVDFLFATPVGF